MHEEQYPVVHCKVCGQIERASFNETVQKQMVERSMCFLCNFWENKAIEGCETVIDGNVYSPGNRIKGNFRGMGGRRFDIVYNDGTKITTFDLWNAGQIPECFRDRIPDTAKFEGCMKADLPYKDTTACWNPVMDATKPCYPLPKDVGKGPKDG